MGTRVFITVVVAAILAGACAPAPEVTPTATQAPTPSATTTSTPSPVPTLTPNPSATAAPASTPLRLPDAVPEATPSPPDLTVGDCPEAPEGGQPRPCPDDYTDWIRRFSAPPGFEIDFVGALPEGAFPTTMTYGPDGRLYVAAVPDPFQDESRIGTIWVQAGDAFESFATGFMMPGGLAFHPHSGDLYVSHRASDSEGQLSRIPAGGDETEPLVTGLPCCYTPREHQPNGIVFGPDGFLYMGLGARTDHGPDPDQPNLPDTLHPLEASILRISVVPSQDGGPDGASVEKYADGFRNPYDIAFDSVGQLWTTDNGPDFGPPERLHRVQPGGHYGFPYYEGCPACAPAPASLEITPPFAEFMPHATPAGLVVNTGAQYPANYYDNVFVTLWNPWVSPGLWRVRPTGEVEPFVLGLFSPVDVVQAPDGSLVVIDFFFGHVFRIRWVG